MAVTPEATAGGTRPGQRQQTAAGPQQHAADVEAAFSLSCARRWAECDRTCSVALTAVNALCLPARLRQGPPLRAAAVAAALHAALALPGLLAWLARGWYLPRRTAVVTACLLASWVLVEAPQPATLSQAHYLPLLWPKFLAVSQCLGLSLLTMSFRLPFQAFLWVQLAGGATSAWRAVATLCRYPAFSSCAAQRSFAAAARLATALSGVLSPLGGLLPLDCCAAPEECAAGAAAAGASASGACSCIQWALFLLLAVGLGLPVAAHYLIRLAGKRKFVRSFCTRRACASCAPAKGADLAVQAAVAALLLLGFSAASWQLTSVLCIQ